MGKRITLTDRASALDKFAAAFGDDALQIHFGGLLTCSEADALAGALVALSSDDAADLLLEAHVASDEEGDRHHDEAHRTTASNVGRPPASARADAVRSIHNLDFPELLLAQDCMVFLATATEGGALAGDLEGPAGELVE